MSIIRWVIALKLVVKMFSLLKERNTTYTRIHPDIGPKDIRNFGYSFLLNSTTLKLNVLDAWSVMHGILTSLLKYAKNIGWFHFQILGGYIIPFISSSQKIQMPYRPPVIAKGNHETNFVRGRLRFLKFL